jgi:DNA-directed RNA polymerase subunit RPC12/RpoP
VATQLSCDCGKQFLVDAANHGKQVQCPACRAAIQVPDDRGGKPAPRPLLTEPEPADDLIVFECPACGNAMKARASYAGRLTRCPKCQAAVTIHGKESRRSPLEKKASGRRLLLLAGGLLLLVGGILLAFLFTSWGERKGDIDDLSLVPADAQGLVCIKVGALWETPAVR